ncbi:MAG: cupin domain-containing protein [Vicinamibacterales bacterium]
MSRADDLIAALSLRPHPEGGWYAEVFRSASTVTPADGRGARSSLPTIDFLLTAGQVSRLHRVQSDEAWRYYEGAPLELTVAPGDLASLSRATPGPVGTASAPVFTVPAGFWQGARPLGAYTPARSVSHLLLCERVRRNGRHNRRPFLAPACIGRRRRGGLDDRRGRGKRFQRLARHDPAHLVAVERLAHQQGVGHVEDVLHYQAERVDMIVHREELLRAIWGYGEVPLARRAVDQAIMRLRKKIERDVHRPAFIHTAHGDGYFLTTDDAGGGTRPERG